MTRFVALVLLPAFVLGCCPPKQWRGMVFVDYSMRGADGMDHRSEVNDAFCTNKYLNTEQSTYMPSYNSV